MLEYINVSIIGVPRETQLRALKLLNAVLEEGERREIFKFAYKTMRNRWERLNNTLSMSKRFSVQKIAPQFCSFQKVRGPSPAYAWVKCERQEDKDCYSVLKAANIDGRAGSVFSADDHYVRLSLIKSQDDFEILLDKITKLVAEEKGARYM
ncbi:Tryptophan aminotransferase-related protein [Quillaja saponaria]|uniref:Tryptophan aminotransferase-related protein n=1 Tax=Quillaja saponaria TaxID=32244 RepID=A0AAD7M4M1_QUISA|nr:Tryptophan aminotransferase-related protein [Quillaja saponaria]